MLLPALLSLLSLPLAIGLTFNRDDLGVVRQAVDEGDGTGRVRKDGAPLLEGEVRGDDQGLLLVPAADDLEEEVGRVRVVREIADLIDREERRSQVGPEAVLERAGGLLLGEVEDQVGGREEARGMAREDRLVDEILGDHRFAEAVRGDDNHVFALRQEVEGEDAVDGRPMQVRGPIPFEIGRGGRQITQKKQIMKNLWAILSALALTLTFSAVFCAMDTFILESKSLPQCGSL